MLLRLIVSAFFLAGPCQAAVFLPLESPLPNSRLSKALKVSANGKHVIGNFITSGPQLVLPAIWDSTGSAQVPALGLSPGLYAFATAVTNDETLFAEDEDRNTIVWNPATGYATFEAFSATNEVEINDVTGNGNWLVGGTVSGPNRPFQEAYRWSVSDGLTLLGQLTDGHDQSIANAISEDASVVVGTAYNAGLQQAFRWTEETGMIGLGWLGGAPANDRRKYSWATAISADGRVIGGTSIDFSSTAGWQVFLWQQDTGMLPLEFLPGFNSADVGGLSEDGRIAVGGQGVLLVDIFNQTDPVAYVWDATHGVRDLQKLLTQEFGLEEQLEGWHLRRAFDISSDGLTIVGEGENPAGQRQGWIVHLDRSLIIPEPPTAVLAAIACSSLGVGRFFFSSDRFRDQ